MKSYHCRTMATVMALIGLLAGCATVSVDQPKSHTVAITDTADT
jgi:hypothetical protein